MKNKSEKNLQKNIFQMFVDKEYIIYNDILGSIRMDFFFSFVKLEVLFLREFLLFTLTIAP